MVVIANPIENMFIGPKKISVVNYEGEEKEEMLEIMFEDIAFQLEEMDNSLGSVLKIKDKMKLIKGILYAFPLRKGFYLKLELENKSHIRRNIRFYLSSNTFKWDNVREGWLIGRERYLIIKNVEIKEKDKSVVEIELDPIESQSILILYGERDYIDTISNTQESRLLHYILPNDNYRESKEFVSMVYDIINSFIIKTDNALLNDLVNTSKSLIASSVKVVNGKIKYVELDKNPIREILFSIVLLEMGMDEIVEKYLREYKKKIREHTYEYLFLLKMFSKLSEHRDKIDDLLDYSTKIKAKNTNVLFEYLYKEDPNIGVSVIEYISKDKNILEDPLVSYLLVKFYLKNIPQSIKDFVLLKLKKEEHKYTHLIARMEVNDYDTLKNYLLKYNDVFFAAVVFMKYFKEIIEIDMNNLLHKISLKFKEGYEKKILYRDISHKNINLNILYDRERKKIDISYEDNLKQYTLDIDLPSKEYEIYVNHKKIPHVYSHKNIKIRI